MRDETKLIKTLLSDNFPNNKFYFKFCEANNYINSSDAIKIKCVSPCDLDEIISVLDANSKGMAIYKQGFHDSIYERQINSQVFVNNKWEDIGLTEFIEVSFSN